MTKGPGTERQGLQNVWCLYITMNALFIVYKYTFTSVYADPSVRGPDSQLGGMYNRVIG